MNEAEPITVACLDLAGTTVADTDTVHTAFAEAIAALGIVSGTAAYERALTRFRGSRGRPWPDLVLTAALRFGVDDVRNIAVCGDTAADMRSGRSSGASIIAGVLTGAHDRDRLLTAGATHILPSVAALPDLVLPAPVDDTVTVDHG